MNVKGYEFHARATDIPFVIVNNLYKKGSYSDAELVSFIQDGEISIYFSKQGWKEASAIGEQMLDKEFFKTLIKKVREIEKRIDSFSFSFKENTIIKEWDEFDNIVFEYGSVYRFCEYPFFKSIEDILLKNHSADVLNKVLHSKEDLTNKDFSNQDKRIIQVLKEIGEIKLSLHLKNGKMFKDLNLFLEYLGKKIGFSKEDVAFLKSNEIKDILEGKEINLKLIEKRKKGCVFFREKDENYACATGKKFLELKDIVEPKTKEIKGFPASKGKVRGKVRVHLSWIKSIDLDKGDIIVTGMTNPQMFPYLEKAAAIVTDEGGITCHAAIVSRELGIPCIIGTKIATRVLKDGDIVEVDADKGIVRKINK